MPDSIYNLHIFQGIERDIVENIVANCKEKNFQKNDVIITEGETSNGEGYIIRSGSVSVKIHDNIIAELQDGDMFGEIALLNDEARTASVKANTDISVIVLTINDLIEMINNDENQINKEIIRRIEENIENS